MTEYDYTVTVTAKDRKTADQLVSERGLNVPPFKCGPPFKSKAVIAASRPVNVLCIRDPDGPNEYVSDGEINEITIDIGGSWSDASEFGACLVEGEDDDAVDYEREMLARVADLDPSNPVRVAVESFFAEARVYGSAA